jgi:hypothetical protein
MATSSEPVTVRVQSLQCARSAGAVTAATGAAVAIDAAPAQQYNTGQDNDKEQLTIQGRT